MKAIIVGDAVKMQKNIDRPFCGTILFAAVNLQKNEIDIVIGRVRAINS